MMSCADLYLYYYSGGGGPRWVGEKWYVQEGSIEILEEGGAFLIIVICSGIWLNNG